LADIKFIVGVDTTTGVASIKQFDGALEQMGEQAKKTEKAHAGLTGSISVGNFIADQASKAFDRLKNEFFDCFTQALEADKIQRTLDSTLRANNESVLIVGEGINRFASQMQAMTGVTDDDVKAMAALTLNLGINKEQMQEVIRGAIGLTSIYGGSLPANLQAVAKAYQGNWDSANSLIPEVKSLADESDKMGMLQKKMAEGFSATTENMKGQSGQLAIVKNDWINFKQSAGEAMLGIFSGVKKLSDSLTGHSALLARMKREQDEYNAAMEEAKKTHVTYADILHDELNPSKEIAETLAWMNENLDENGKLIKKVTKETKDLNGENKKAGDSVGKLVKAEDKHADLIKKMPPATKAATAALNGELSPAVVKLGNEIDNVSDSLLDFSIASSSAMDDFMANATEAWAKYGETAQNIIYGIDAIIMQSYRNQEIAMDNEYKKKVDAIEKSKMNEQEKADALAALDEEFDAKRSALKAKQAKQDKAMSMIQATINTFEAASKAYTLGPIIGPIFAGIITALGLGLVAKIKAQPIPLAKGGIFDRPTLMAGGAYQVAEAGEKEVVAPLSGLRRELGMDKHQSSGSIVIQNRIYLDGHEMKQFITRVIEEKGRTGKLKLAPKAVRT